MTSAFWLLLALAADPAAPTDWPALVQKPYAGRPVPDLGLRPLLVLGGDSADGDASLPFVQAVMPVYELLGVGDRVGLFNHRGKHSFPKEGRRIAYQWLDHWLRFTPARDE